MDGNRILSELRKHKANFDSWKADWSASRAQKLDSIDATVSSRASGVDVSNILAKVGNIGGCIGEHKQARCTDG